MQVGQLYRQVRDGFRSAGLATPELDAKLLVAEALGLSVSNMLLRERDDCTEAQVMVATAFADRRVEGMPVGRILGEREFFGRSFRLNESTLEPRPDTEILIETVLDRSHPQAPLSMCDIGTGSGAIAVTLLAELKNASMLAIDISENALACAIANAERNGVGDRFYPVCADYGAALGGGFDWVVSNPPYIRTSDLAGLHPEVVRHDPRLALDGGPDGLSAYRAIVAQAWKVLVDGGRIALEIGFDQGGDLKNQLRLQGFGDIEIIKDLRGRDRVATGRKI